MTPPLLRGGGKEYRLGRGFLHLENTLWDGAFVYRGGVNDRIVGVLLAAGASSRMGSHLSLIHI